MLKLLFLPALAVSAVLALSACGGGSDAPGTAPAASDPALVQTTEGAVAGKPGDGQTAFLGIPFAQPPVGPLRLAPPQAPARRSTTLQAKAFGAACPQAGPGAEAGSAEDCLFLNVWKPAGATPDSKLPVLVYVHGGAFVLGSGALDFSNFARKGMVVVTLNYRLGALGYLANNALRAANRDGTLGNFALLDQLMALGWVQRNIAAFGGDAGNVTLWGTSAGATQGFSLLHSPKAKGLFHRAVLQSGGGGEYSNLAAETALAIGDTAVAKLGCSTAADIAACLRAQPVSALLAQGGSKWRPTVDAQILTQVPARAFATGNFNQVPVMIGGVYDEGTLFVDQALTPELYPLYLRGLAPAGHDTSRIEAAYPLSRFAVPAQGIARAIGDAMYGCGNSARRDALAAWVPVYGWELTDPALSFPAAPKAFYYGTAHGMDSFYWGDTVEQIGTYPFFDAAARLASGAVPDRKALAVQMHAYLANFVKTGDPNGDGKNLPVRWPRYAGPADRTMVHFSMPATTVSNTDFERTHGCDTLWGPGVFPAIY